MTSSLRTDPPSVHRLRPVRTGDAPDVLAAFDSAADMARQGAVSTLTQAEELVTWLLAAGFVHEGTERAKFLLDGERVDVLTYGRLVTDPAPRTAGLPWQA